MPEKDVLGDGQIDQERLLLVHHPDAVGRRLGGMAQDDRVAVVHDPATVRLVHAGEDLHQRRLAGSVLADQAHDLARPDGEAHRLQRVDAGEALVDALELERCGLGHLTIRMRERSSESATAAMISSPCTPVCT